MRRACRASATSLAAHCWDSLSLPLADLLSPFPATRADCVPEALEEKAFPFPG